MNKIIFTFICSFVICHLTLVYAMSGPAPKKTEDTKYKLEILKMEIVPAPSAESARKAK